jgi:hypothetical protein
MTHSNNSNFPPWLLRSPPPDGVAKTEAAGGQVPKDPAACEWDQWRPIKDVGEFATA